MTIKQAIEQLTRLAAKHGDDCEVFYDCGFCGKATRPDVVVAAVDLRKDPRP